MKSKKKLLLTSFRNALASLEKAIAEPKNEYVRDAVIKRFEYTFELAWKMMQRHLVWSGDDTKYSKRDLFRETARLGIIADADTWFDYNFYRNETSHSYSEVTADEVYEAAKKFAEDARLLLTYLETYHD